MGNVTSTQIPIVQGSITMGSMISKKSQASEDDNCIICIDNLSNDYATLQCGHHFHRACVKPWMLRRQSCPICRQHDAITFPPLVVLPPIRIEEVSHENPPLIITPTIRIPNLSYEDQYFIMNATIAHDIQAAIAMTMNEYPRSNQSLVLSSNGWHHQSESSSFIGSIDLHDTVINRNLQADESSYVRFAPRQQIANDDDQWEQLEPII